MDRIPGGAVRVVGVGQRLAADDGVGPAVVEYLRSQGLPEGVEAVTEADPGELPGLLSDASFAVIVDALRSETLPPGRVLVLSPRELARGPVRPLSSHGMSVTQALELAALLLEDLPPVRVVGVTVDRVDPYRAGLTPAVAAAVAEAARLVREELRSHARDLPGQADPEAGPGGG